MISDWSLFVNCCIPITLQNLDIDTETDGTKIASLKSQSSFKLSTLIKYF